MRWNKKSQAIITMLAFLFIELVIIVIVFYKIGKAGDDTTFQKKFYSKDLGLLVDSLHASNGEFKITYDISLPEKMKLDFQLQPDRVILTDRSNIPPDKRTQTAALFGYNNYVKVIPANISKDGGFQFTIVSGKTNITFSVPQQDVKLKEEQDVPLKEKEATI